ncbi:MAG: hypothetical protein Q8M92_09950, partial [Candidatus Subteraquimicrobiales bacterium]|nr:hypothetical protein [Candidatus Subteraquimicrobiales bacterium]
MAEEQFCITDLFMHFPESCRGDLLGHFIGTGDLRGTMIARLVDRIILVVISAGNAEDGFIFLM